MKTMNKCKIAKRRGMRLLLVKGLKGQQLSEWEFNAINSDEVTGLLHLDARKKGLIYNLEYDITGFIPFLEFLRIPMNREVFARVLDNILENLRSVNEKHFNPQLILYDMDKIYINPSTQRLFFAYVPLQPFENGGSLQQMLRAIIQHGAFDEEEDCGYITEYITILNSGINFSAFDLEEVRARIDEMEGASRGHGAVQLRLQAAGPYGQHQPGQASGLRYVSGYGRRADTGKPAPSSGEAGHHAGKTGSGA